MTVEGSETHEIKELSVEEYTFLKDNGMEFIDKVLWGTLYFPDWSDIGISGEGFGFIPKSVCIDIECPNNEVQEKELKTVVAEMNVQIERKADKYTITKMCQIFCDRIIAAGYQAGVYASLYWFDEKMYIEELEKYNIWLSQWNDKITANFRVDIWQYTSDGHIEAIGGRVDMNTCYKYFDIDGDTEETGIYQNGSTKEPVYSDTKLKHQIGYLNPWEKCDYLGITMGRAIVKYKVDNEDNYKIGFVEWLGGVQ
jgi:hypothetical protein